jgi:pSer/pThr/pTyr-binding forkhead associated (FHA) protein
MFHIGHKTCKEGHIMDPTWKKCPICLAPVCGWLVVLSGEEKNKVYTIHTGKMKIGTGIDCEIRIFLDTISSHHVIINAKKGTYIATDLSSATGTYLNNIQISSHEIIDGDILKLGDVEFIFKCL